MRFLFSRKGSSAPPSPLPTHHNKSSHGAQTVNTMSEAMGLIHLAPRTTKGYLIAGRTYVSQNKLQEALAIYNQGLICVPPNTHGYNRLERNAAIVAQEMKRQVTDKIISLVFGHLSEAELVQCTMVCSSWRCFLVEWPSFQERIHAAFPQLSMEAFKTPLQHLGLIGDNNYQHTSSLSPASKKLLSTTSLISLRLEHVSIPDTIVTSLALDRIELVQYTHLTEEDLALCQSIPHVRIIVPTSDSFPVLSANASFHFRSLEIVVLDHAGAQMDKIIQLVRQSSDLVYLSLNITACPSKHVDQVEWASDRNMTLSLTGISQALGPLLALLQPILGTLYLDNVALVNDIPDVLPRLKTLECDNIISTATIRPLVTKLIDASPCLASASFKGSTDVTDTVLDALSKRQETMTYLQITARPRFSPAGLMQMASRCLNLTSITLDFLHRDLVPVLRRWSTLRHLTLICPPQSQDSHSHLDGALVAQVRDLMIRRNGQLTLVDGARAF